MMAFVIGLLKAPTDQPPASVLRAAIYALEVAAAAHAAGLKLGWYISGADWYHPAYPKPYARDWPMRWGGNPRSRPRRIATYAASSADRINDALWENRHAVVGWLLTSPLRRTGDD